MSGLEARGRLPGEPVAIVDIGSNSVRLVAYESLSRALTPIFNEKVLCGLGRGVATTGFLTEDATARALAALLRFRVLCRTMGIANLRAVATAAVRDAANGPQFLELAERAIGCEIDLLAGPREAQLSALGVASSIWAADGMVGDLGGGSLELADVAGGKVGRGVTLPLGGLSLLELSDRSPKKASKIARDALQKVKTLDNLADRTFYAVGGTWRALARLHMSQRQYPMRVMHNYVIPTRDALEFVKLVERIETEALTSIETVSTARRPLLVYGAAVLEEIIRRAPPKEIVISALGVREGLLFEGLSPEEQVQDPLITAARQFNLLRSRSPGHAEELFHWTSQFSAPPISRSRPRRRGCATPPACSPTSPGGPIPIIAVNNPTTSSPTPPSSASTTRRAPISPSPLLIATFRAIRKSARMRARWCRRASSIGRVCSAPRCVSPTSSRRRCPACCRAPPWRCSGAGSC